MFLTKKTKLFKKVSAYVVLQFSNYLLKLYFKTLSIKKNIDWDNDGGIPCVVLKILIIVKNRKDFIVNKNTFLMNYF